jgi:hypothetical protein
MMLKSATRMNRSRRVMVRARVWANMLKRYEDESGKGCDGM